VINSVTHFEIFAEEPANLVEFYRNLLGWQIEKAPGVDYWRIQTAPAGAVSINDGLTFRPIPGPHSWVHYLCVQSLEQTLEQLLKLGGGSAAEDRRAEDGMVCGGIVPADQWQNLGSPHDIAVRGWLHMPELGVTFKF
jgi:predicted enzyme related to lactoylglutathione lyase